MFIIVVLLSGAAAFYRGAAKRRHGSTDDKYASALSESKPKFDEAISTSKAKVVEGVSTALNGWSNCTANPPRKSVTIDKKLEPLWLPNYPTSFPSIAYADFIFALTGIVNGAKSYYRQSKSLKKCHHPNSSDLVQGITCEIVHPIIPCDRPSPSSQAANFGNVVLLALRNPLTTFPAHHQTKAEAYHGQKGQVENKSWVDFRDEWVGTGRDSHLFKEWKNFIMEWRDMKPYTVDTYMPYEYWTDEKNGPALVKRIAGVLKKEGFPVGYDDETVLGCMWHKHFYEPIIAEEKKRADEGWYVPEYTKDQLEMMASGLDLFVQEINNMQQNEDKKRPGDEHLIGILKSYSKTIREKM